MLQQFINRKAELEFLERKYAENTSNLTVLYGKRRVGKTELIKKFLHGKKGAYLLCTKDSLEENIKEMKQKFFELTGKEYFLALETKSFLELFKYLADEVKKEKIIVVIDEFPYLIELNSGIVSVFQKIWDEQLANTNIFLILCGSSIAMMETEVLDYKSPLYGRRTGEWKVEPLKFGDACQFFKNYSIEDLVRIWAVCGGTPFYLSKMDSNISVEENIKQKILRKGEVLYNEPLVILKEEFREPKTYTLILKYLSLGYNTQGELFSVTGIEKGNLSKYLSVLEETHIVEYMLPLGQRKRGIYVLDDQFFSFWFKFVYPNKSDLEIGNIAEVFSKISRDINAFYGRAFENLIFDHVRLKEIKLPFSFTEVRKWWHKDKEIDILAVNDQTKEILFAECKWQNLSYRDVEKLMNSLKEKSTHVNWSIGDRKEHFAIFAKKIEGKEALRKSGFLVWDLDDY